jgi:hypothetical protein
MENTFVFRRVAIKEIDNHYLISSCGRFVWSERSGRFLKIDSEGRVTLKGINGRTRFRTIDLVGNPVVILPYSKRYTKGFVISALVFIAVVCYMSSDIDVRIQKRLFVFLDKIGFNLF